MKRFGLLIIISMSVVLYGCPAEGQSKPKKVTQSQKAAKAAESISFTENAEIENIKKRLQLTSDPGLTGFVLLMNEAGQPIMYTGVTGKITSGGKRLTAPIQSWNHNYKGSKGAGLSGYDTGTLGPAPSDEGTWGSSNPYIYFWSTSGQYIQWNGKYLYSDKPFRTTVEPLVIATEVQQ